MGSWPNPQTLDQAGKTCQGQMLSSLFGLCQWREKEFSNISTRSFFKIVRVRSWPWTASATRSCLSKRSEKMRRLVWVGMDRCGMGWVVYDNELRFNYQYSLLSEQLSTLSKSLNHFALFIKLSNCSLYIKALVLLCIRLCLRKPKLLCFLLITFVINFQFNFFCF
jgi:hypothetical protein